MNWTCPKCGRTFARQDQQHYCEKPKTVDEYIAFQDKRIQPKLREIRPGHYVFMNDREKAEYEKKLEEMEKEPIIE